MSDFEIGIIIKPQGIRGELRVLPTTDDPARFGLLAGEEVRIASASYTLAGARAHKGLVIVKLAGVDDRDAAQALAGKAIAIPPEKALPLGPGEYYVRDLIGLRAESEEGEALGAISRVFRTGANDVYVIDAPGEPFMVPAIKDVVRAVDLAEGKIILRLMAGLRELRP